MGLNDCARDGDQTFQVLLGKAQSTDPDYIALSGTPVNVVNQDNGDVLRTTNNNALHICGFAVVSERKVNRSTWEYQLRAELTNTGTSVGGVVAKLQRLPYGMQAVEDTLIFGAVNTDETAKTNDTVTVRSRFPVPWSQLRGRSSPRWTVVVQP